MSNSNNEQERLKRLRDQQLAARDPLVKQKQFQRDTIKKERIARNKKVSFAERWDIIPHVGRNIIYAILLGVVALFVVPMVWNSQWTLICIGGGTLVAIVLGVIIGQAQDSRDEIKRML